MSTLAQIQAETLDAEVRRLVVADQFATDWLLVAENDFNSYSQLVDDSKELDTVQLSDKIRGEWEHLAEQVTELVEDNISGPAALFISQMLQGQGSLPFDIIARHVLENYKTN